ncbi:RNA-guided endonuclease TnpB family protein [Mycobacterium avium subsp. hominissuis]|uniref:RNA-guided endonuclease InsQ/TnpB family protein n=1 Tax=Mycobacterium avium TaxID=1764 RepID=UPI00266666DD|nr:RNA-guided endonuclease TnpB family protein [Mycobacterium avium]MDO2394861.1 RNA-guided endonuclease TnpB family protein [Mycobacterium avium subsp. hominissuis]
MTIGDVEMRAYRFALDLTPTQEQQCRQHAGAARWAYNHALAAKFAALDARQATITALVEQGFDPKVAAAQAPKIPTKPAVQKALNGTKGDDRTDVDGDCPWWHTVSTYAFQSAFADVDTAWKNWIDSITGKRHGQRVSRPRFKTKHRSRDSFRIHHDIKNPVIRPDTGYRRIIVPRLGSLRVHDSTKKLCRALSRGAIIQSVTISRGGHRWYASILTKTPAAITAAPTRRQRAAGTVGVDVGIHHLAALSTGDIIDNPRHLQRAQGRLTKAQRKLSRTQKGSTRRRRAAAAVGRRHHEVAEQRATTLHTLTKQLTTSWAAVAIEDLNVAGMTRSTRGTIDQPGTNVRAKAGLNRALLDTAPGELRRQLSYKTRWYGSTLAICDRWYPSSQTCSNCGARTKLPLSQRVYRCAECGLDLDRDVNAAINIATRAVAVASDTEETQNARRGLATAPTSVGQRCQVTDAGRPHHHGAATSVEQSTDHPQTADQRLLPLVS